MIDLGLEHKQPSDHQQITPRPQPDAIEIRKALDVLCGPDAVVELRAIHKRRKRTDAGYFDGDHRNALLSAAVKLNQEDAAVYITLNPVDPQLLGRYNNRIQQFASSTATDANVISRRWLLVDIDPIRPKDTAATDEQLEQAKQKGREIFSYLKSCRWPEPVVAESGNGMHLLYRVDLSNDDQSRDLIKGILNALADQFDNNTISIDRSVFNAARIIKLHGTVATKGDHTVSNPWRLSKIITIPKSIGTVSHDQLQAIVPVRSPEAPRRRPTINSLFNLDDFLSRLAIPYQMDMHSGRERYKLDYCPFNQDHGKGDAAIFKDVNGVLGFKCLHNGCADKTWQDVRTLLDGPVADRRMTTSATAVPAANVMAEEWELTSPDWPVMNSRAYHGIAADFIDLATRNSEADPAAILATFLVRFGVEVGPGAYMQVGDSRHRARLASVIVGASSKARKGTSGKPVEKLFDFSNLQLENLTTARASKGPFSSGEGVIFAIRDPVYRWNVKDQVQEIVDPGVDDKRLFVLDEEFGGVLANTKREGNTLSMIIRQAWDSGNFDPLTKNNKTTATGGHVGWASHITLTELHSKLDESEGFNGFANRILWVCARRKKLVSIPEPMPQDELVIIQRRLVDILRGIGQGTEIKLGDEAKAAWSNRYYADLTKDRPGLSGCVTNRGEAQALRLAMIYCLLDGQTVISLDHLKAGLAFWGYCRQSANCIFHGRQRETTAQTILTAVKKEPLTATKIHALFGNNANKTKLATALSELIASGQIVAEKRSNSKTRPTIFYIYNETFYEINEINEINELSPESDSLDPTKLVNSFNSLEGAPEYAEEGVIE